MKKTVLLLVSLFVLTILNAQTKKKKTIAITPFDAVSHVPSKYVKAIQTKVVEAFQNTGRFDIVDRTSYNKIKQEKELQKTEDFMDGQVVEQAKMSGAEAIVAGTVNSVDIYLKRVRMTDGTIKEYYDCTMSVSLKVIDVATGQVLGTKVLNPKRGFMGSFLGSSGIGPKTPEKAFALTLKKMEKPIQKFVAEYFPIVTSIIQIIEAKKNSAKKVLINTGEADGAKKNQVFSVYEIQELNVGGKKINRKVEIGKLKITKVEGDEVSEAKVVKGNKDIFAKFNGGVKLECYSKK